MKAAFVEILVTKVKHNNNITTEAFQSFFNHYSEARLPMQISNVNSLETSSLHE